MNEVSVRVMPSLLERLQRQGVDTAPLFDGLRVRPADIQQWNNRFDWDDFARLLERVAAALDDEDALVNAGVRFVGHPAISAWIPIFGVAIRPRMLVTLLTRWWGPMLFRCVRTETRWHGPRELELTLSIPAEYRDSPEFFRVNTGAFSLLGYFSGGAPASVELQLSPRKGVYRIVLPERPSLKQFAATAASFIGGAPVLIKQLIRQQDELNAALRELQHSEQRYRLLVENSADVIWRYDVTSRKVTFASRAVQELLGYSQDEVKELPLARLVFPEDAARLRGTMMAPGAGGGFVIETRLRHRSGDPVWVEVRVSPQRDADGEVVALQGITRDVGARREAEAEHLRALVAESARHELEREIEVRRRVEAELLEAKEAAEASNRLKTSILANLSHEIRTPLTALIGFAQVLGRSVKGSPQEDQARIIHSSGRRLLALLDNMLELARADADKISVDPETYPLARVVGDVTLLLAAHAAEKGISVVTNVPPDLCVVSDPRRDEQVLLNVVGNAVRYTDAGTIGIDAVPLVDAGARWVEITVVDTGIGISAEFLPCVFDEFRQEAIDGDRRQEGSGLGLALAKRFVERVGGSIAVASEKGRGTTVRIRLPAA